MTTTAKPARPLPPSNTLPKLTDHAPFKAAVEKAAKIAEMGRPLQVELAAIDAKIAEAMQADKAVKVSRAATLAQIMATGEPAKEWQLPTPLTRLQKLRADAQERMNIMELAARIHLEDELRPARAEALRLAQVVVVRDHFAPAVTAMLAPLVEFAERAEDVARLLRELEAAGLDGGAVATPHVPWHRFGGGQDTAAAVQSYVRDVADTGSITPKDAAKLLG